MTDLETQAMEKLALERDEARELHREVVRHLVEQIAELVRARDRALACEAAARGLLAALSSHPSPTSAGEARVVFTPVGPVTLSPPPEVERGKCGECRCDRCGYQESVHNEYGCTTPACICGVSR